MSFIDVQHLSKTYDVEVKQSGLRGSLRSLFHPTLKQVEAVRDVSFSIEAGEIVAFIGPNGAGKTTTLKMLSGILWPSGGMATVMGHVPWKREKEFQQRFGIVLGAKRQLWWDLPARDTFLLNKEIYDIADGDFRERIRLLSEGLNITHVLDTPVRQLSLGERMKCELVNALLHAPSLLYLDEPTIGLDVVSVGIMRQFLKDWNKREGTTIILTSHSMADVEALCERAIVIDQGSIRYDGSLNRLKEQTESQKRLVIHLQKKTPKRALESLGKIIRYENDTATLGIDKQNAPDIVRRALETLPVHDLSIQDRPLEDVVRELFLKQ